MRLERFHQAKQAEVAALRLAAERENLPEPLTASRPDFAAALSTPASGATLAVVAEYKRASPSRGVIREDLDVEEVVRQYAAAGADALSILTEETWFHGRLDFLTRAAAPGLYPAAPLPLLRKDFIFDSLQVRATAATPASALLLIVRLTPEARLLRNCGKRPKALACTPWWKYLTRRICAWPARAGRASSRSMPGICKPLPWTARPACLWPGPARRKTAKSGWRPAASAARNIWSRPPKRAIRPLWWVPL